MRRFLITAFGALFMAFAAAGHASAQSADIVVELAPGESQQILIDGVLTTVTDGFVIPDGADVSFPSGNTGSVTLSFADGTTVDLTPGSQVKVSTSTGGTPTVEVASGDVSVDAGTGGSVSVTTPDGTTATGDEISVAVNDDGTSSIDNDGDTPITVVTQDGGTQTVAAGGTTTTTGTTTATVTPTPTPVVVEEEEVEVVVVVENALQDTGDGSPQLP